MPKSFQHGRKLQMSWNWWKHYKLNVISVGLQTSEARITIWSYTHGSSNQGMKKRRAWYRTCKQAELTANPLNILENTFVLLQPVNCRLTALDFWCVAGLVQPYYGIQLHLRDYLNVCLSISSIKMRLLNDWQQSIKEINFAATVQHHHCLKVRQIVLLHPLLYRHEICLSDWVEQRQWRPFHTTTQGRF